MQERVHETDGAEWRFKVRSPIACPHEYGFPPPPNGTRKWPKGKQTWKKEWHLKKGETKGKRFGIDVKRLPVEEKEHVMVYWHYHPEDIRRPGRDEFHRALYKFHPTRQVPCPDGADCGPYKDDKANIWQCLRTDHWSNYHKCYPIGDSRNGLSIQAYNNENHLHGVQVVYDGGVSYNSSVELKTVFEFFCDTELPYGAIEWIPFSHQNETHIVLMATTRETCLLQDYGYGGVFCQIVFLAAILYFVIGGLVCWALTGEYLPHAAFWTEFAACIGSAVTFIAHCGKVSVGLSYDKI